MGSFFTRQFDLQLPFPVIPVCAIGSIIGSILQQHLRQQLVPAVTVVRPAVKKHFSDWPKQNASNKRVAPGISPAR